MSDINKLNSQDIEVIEDIDTIDNIYIQIIEDYAIKHNIKDINKIPPTQWSSIIFIINKRYIEPNKYKLMIPDNRISSEYDIHKINDLYTTYWRLCNDYNQEINISDFCRFIGVERQTIYNYAEKLSGTNLDIFSKIKRDNEQSLFNLMRIQGANAVPNLAKLNKYHNWNGAGTTNKVAAAAALTAADLPKLAPAPQTNQITSNENK